MDAGSIQGRAAIAARSAQEQALDGLRSGASRTSPAEAARKFEALFATQLVKEMRQTLPQGFFGEGPQADVYSGWLDQFVGESIAKDGGLHLADGLRRTLERARAAEAAATNEAPSARAVATSPMSSPSPASSTNEVRP